MIYLAALPIIVIAVMVNKTANRYKMDITAKISKIVIILGVLFFIHFYLVSKGFNIIDIIIKFFTL